MQNKEKQQVLFSIHVPVYKTEQYLPQCVESILNQTYSKFELFLMDDGSPDHCPELCDLYEKRDNRVHALHQENQGLLMARRNSLKYTTGDYCLFVDSDDWVAPNWLESIYDTIIENDPDVVLFDWFIVTEGKTIENHTGLDPKVIYGETAEKSNVYRLFLSGNSLNSLATKAIKTEIVGIEQSYEEYRGIQQDEDALQTMYPLQKAEKIVYVNKPLYYYRQNDCGICHNNSLRRFAEICGSLDNKKKFGERIGELQKNIKEFSNYIFKIYSGLYVEMAKSSLTYKQKKEVCGLIRESEAYKEHSKNAVSYADGWKDALKFKLICSECDIALLCLAHARILLNHWKKDPAVK